MTDAATAPAQKPPPLLSRLSAEHPSLAAAAALLLVSGPALAAFVWSLREQEGAWTAVALVYLLAGLIPAAGVRLRKGWGFAFGQAICWPILVGALLRGLSSRFGPPVYAAAAYAALVWNLFNLARPAAPPGTGERRPESVDQWVRENIEAIIVAFMMALVIRCFCIEVFKIPSSSMEPTLLGDVGPDHGLSGCPFNLYHGREVGGDRIMVTKYYYSFSDVERYDVVVFKFPLNQAKNFIKRVVGLPGETLKIQGGNLYVRKRGSPDFEIARRPLRIQDSLWINPSESPDFLRPGGEFDAHWDAMPVEGENKASHTVVDRELVTHEAAGRRSLQFEYKLGGRPVTDGGSPVGEVHLAFDFEISSPKGEVFARISNEFGRFEVRFHTDREGELTWRAPDADGQQVVKVPTRTEALKGVRLALDRSYRFSLSIWDGTALVRVDGSEAGRITFLTRPGDVAASGSLPREIVFGARDLTFKVRKLRLGRDIHYQGKGSGSLQEGKELEIGDDEFVMMGDNVARSHDARSWTRRVYTLENEDTVECEEQESGGNPTVRWEDFQQKHGLSVRPEVYLGADRFGRPWALYRREDAPKDLPTGVVGIGILKDGRQPTVDEPFHKVRREFIVGKALWTWWPPTRWFRLIR
jgi:signal peptidase I